MAATKTCTKCGETKSVSEFYKLHITKDGLNPQCKACKQKYQTEHYFANDSYRQKRITEATQHNRKRKYGVTPESFETLLKSQNYSCAICSTHLDGSKFSLKGQLDHRHSDGKVRGILCGQCNTALGNLKEDEDILLSAITYLRKHK